MSAPYCVQSQFLVTIKRVSKLKVRETICAIEIKLNKSNILSNLSIME